MKLVKWVYYHYYQSKISQKALSNPDKACAWEDQYRLFFRESIAVKLELVWQIRKNVRFLTSELW